MTSLGDKINAEIRALESERDRLKIVQVPWNAGWSSEERYEIRPCRWTGGQLAVWQPHSPGNGRPLFAKPHMVRQRRSVAEFVCTVCGEKTMRTDRWWFKLAQKRDGWLMTTESPVHRTCAELALKVCPHLRGRDGDLERFPGGFDVIASFVGGDAFERDFGIKVTADQPVIGSLKFAWKI